MKTTLNLSPSSSSWRTTFMPADKTTRLAPSFFSNLSSYLPSLSRRNVCLAGAALGLAFLFLYFYRRPGKSEKNLPSSDAVDHKDAKPPIDSSKESSQVQKFEFALNMIMIGVFELSGMLNKECHFLEKPEVENLVLRYLREVGPSEHSKLMEELRAHKVPIDYSVDYKTPDSHSKRARALEWVRRAKRCLQLGLSKRDTLSNKRVQFMFSQCSVSKDDKLFFEANEKKLEIVIKQGSVDVTSHVIVFVQTCLPIWKVILRDAEAHEKNQVIPEAPLSTQAIVQRFPSSSNVLPNNLEEIVKKYNEMEATGNHAFVKVLPPIDVITNNWGILLISDKVSQELIVIMDPPNNSFYFICLNIQGNPNDFCVRRFDLEGFLFKNSNTPETLEAYNFKNVKIIDRPGMFSVLFPYNSEQSKASA